MQVIIHLGEPYWRITGGRVVNMELDESAVLADLIALLRQRWPALAHDLDEASPMFFVNDTQADLDTRLESGSHVHILWPMAGG
jgi:molybdopterin converting factor small subunit